MLNFFSDVCIRSQIQRKVENTRFSYETINFIFFLDLSDICKVICKVVELLLNIGTRTTVKKKKGK